MWTPDCDEGTIRPPHNSSGSGSNKSSGGGGSARRQQLRLGFDRPRAAVAFPKNKSDPLLLDFVMEPTLIDFGDSPPAADPGQVWQSDRGDYMNMIAEYENDTSCALARYTSTDPKLLKWSLADPSFATTIAAPANGRGTIATTIAASANGRGTIATTIAASANGRSTIATTIAASANGRGTTDGSSSSRSTATAGRAETTAGTTDDDGGEGAARATSGGPVHYQRCSSAPRSSAVSASGAPMFYPLPGSPGLPEGPTHVIDSENGGEAWAVGTYHPATERCVRRRRFL
jgi:hypothetical protein